MYGNMDSRLADIERALDEINTAINSNEATITNTNEKIFKKWINKKSKLKFESRWITEKQKEIKKDDICNICLENYKINERTIFLPCTHDYHYS